MTGSQHSSGTGRHAQDSVHLPDQSSAGAEAGDFAGRVKYKFHVLARLPDEEIRIIGEVSFHPDRSVGLVHSPAAACSG